jgi:hypothetical protein
VFEKRILPIFQSAKPSSCSECHLSGVDLKEYIRPTQQETFVSLVGAGMIDTENPDESKILRFIKRAPENPKLETEDVRKQEYDAFQAWIRAAVADPQLIAVNGDRELVLAVSTAVVDVHLHHSSRIRLHALSSLPDARNQLVPNPHCVFLVPVQFCLQRLVFPLGPHEQHD